MNTNRFRPYTMAENGTKMYPTLSVIAVIGNSIDAYSIHAIESHVDAAIIGNSETEPANLVLEILDNLDTNEQRLCGSKVDSDYIESIIKRPTRIILVAKLDEKIEAFAILFTPEYRDYVEITIICNSAKSKLKRAGAALIHVTAQIAKALGRTKLFLESLPDRKSYYEKFGFVQSNMANDMIPMSANVEELLSGTNGGGRTRRRRRRARRSKTRKY
jgi:hypothetical protein